MTQATTDNLHIPSTNVSDKHQSVLNVNDVWKKLFESNKILVEDIPHITAEFKLFSYTDVDRLYYALEEFNLASELTIIYHHNTDVYVDHLNKTLKHRIVANIKKLYTPVDNRYVMITTSNRLVLIPDVKNIKFKICNDIFTATYQCDDYQLKLFFNLNLNRFIYFQIYGIK